MSSSTPRLNDVLSMDEVALGALYRKLLDGWNERNADEFAALFEADGSLVGFDGSEVNGQAAIAAHLSQIFANHPTAAYVGKLREVRFLNPDVTIVRAVAGTVPPGQSDLNPAVNTIQSLVAVKRDGTWRISLYQNTPAQFHGRPDEVQRLTEELRQLLR